MSLIITGVLDGPLSGGVPKLVELFATEAIDDLSQYGLGSANNGGGSDGVEFTFPTGQLAKGSYIYVASQSGADPFLGITPDYSTSAVNVNGDDAIELFKEGVVIDLFGDPAADGTGQAWEYLDGWASRKPGAVASPTFDIGQWTFSGPNALDGETTNAGAATPFPMRGYSAAPATPSFTISEIDADQDGTDAQEFVEIHDGGIGGVSLDGLTLVLFNGNGDTAYRSIDLTGHVTNADGFFVVGSAAVPEVDLVAWTTNGLQNGADAIALYHGAGPSAPTTDNLIDAIVYGTDDTDDVGLLAALGQSVQFDENANGASTSQSLARSAEGTFVAQAPTPGASNEIAAPTEITLISEIQGRTAGGTVGSDDASTFDGQIVTIRAIVTADFQDGPFGVLGDLNGFYVQEEETDYDFDDLTSEGIFIYDGSSPDTDVQVGDWVEITGTVDEYFGETQIRNITVEVLASGQPLPDAVSIEFPTAQVMKDGSGGYVADLEAYEGMRVSISQDMTVSEMFNLDRFGQYNVSAEGRPVQFTQTNAPDADGFDAHLRDIAARNLVLDDGSTRQNPDTLKIIDGNDGVLTAADSFRMGDTISDISGVVSYSFGEFRIQSATGEYQGGNPRPETPEDIGGNFKVASLNVLNYFTTLDENGNRTDNGSSPRGADNAAEFERQADKLVKAIVAMDADILGLLEIENDFAGDSFAIKDLVGRVNAALGSEVYGFVDPGQEFVGGDAIANGLIYKTGSVALRGDMAILTEHEGRNFLDPLGAGRDLNRAAIAQSFEDLDTGQTLTVSVNHLKSKGSLSGLAADEAQGDGQGNNNATRTEAARILAEWLADDPTGQGVENTLILGDLNAYAKEDPLTALADAGYTDLAAARLGDAAYSYVFDGQVGTLDYALANKALTDKLAGVTEWHVNSDEADALDYNLDFGRDPSLYDGESAARNSDHDPVLVSFDFDKVYELMAGSPKSDWLRGTDGRDEIDAGRGNDRLFGGGHEDLLRGGSGNDRLFGEDGDDWLLDGAGNDRIFGGNGNDKIEIGGGRNDVAFGGDGVDTFIFSAELANDGARDRTVLRDYDAAEDLIDLGGAEIARHRVFGAAVELQLEGGRDTIWVNGVSSLDEIVFTGEHVFA